MVFEEHDYKKFPELTNSQINEFGFTSPHVQIEEDFEAIIEKVKDGDTVQLSTTFRNFTFPLRLANIDAPELNEGGAEAKAWLKGQIEGKKVNVIIDRNNRVGKFGRLIGEIIHGGINVGEMEEAMGFATVIGKAKEHKFKRLEQIFDIKKWF